MTTTAIFGASATDKYFNRPRTDIQSLLPTSPSKVLELGCGAGATIEWLRSIRRVSHTEGVEISASMAERAQTRLDIVHVADIDTWSFSLTCSDFDLVLALDVLEHLHDPWRALRRILTHMQPQGTLITSLPNIAHYSVAFPLALKGKFEYTAWGLLDRTHLRFFTRNSAMKLLKDSGFAVTQTAANKVYPNLLRHIGLNNNRWHWYNNRMMDHLLPERLVDYQLLFKAHPLR